MLHRAIRRVKDTDDAYRAARRAGVGRFGSLAMLADPSRRRAFLRLAHIPCPRASVVMDVGANRGQFLELALARFAPERAVCIEPLPEAFADLQARFGGHPAVSLYPCAAGAASGEVEMQVNRHDQASSVLPIRTQGDLRFTQRDLTPVGAIVVPIRTLDDIAQECDLATIDLLKLDVQGYELEVLRGAERTLPKVHAILTEVSFYALYEGGVLFWDVHRFLEERGFALHWLGDYQTSASGVILQGDAVYTRRAAQPPASG